MSFGGSSQTQKTQAPPPPPNTPTNADASVVSAGVRAIRASRSRSPALATGLGITSTISNAVARKAETAKRTYLGGA